MRQTCVGVELLSWARNFVPTSPKRLYPNERRECSPSHITDQPPLWTMEHKQLRRQPEMSVFPFSFLVLLSRKYLTVVCKNQGSDDQRHTHKYTPTNTQVHVWNTAQSVTKVLSVPLKDPFTSCSCLLVCLHLGCDK